MEVPNSLKTVVPYIRRAEELDRDASNPVSGVVAYYCRFYVAELLMSENTNDAKQLLRELLTRMEADKTRLSLPAEEEAQRVVTDFALQVWNQADLEDQNGMANKGTARSFYAASNFLTMLNHFGAPEPEIENKIKYAKLRATDIMKAVKEGREVPPPPSGSMASIPDEGEADEMPSLSNLGELGSNPTPSQQQHVPRAPPSSSSSFSPPHAPQAPPASQAPRAPPASQVPPSSHTPSPAPSSSSPAPSASGLPSPSYVFPSVDAVQFPSMSSLSIEDGERDAIEYLQFAIASIKHHEVQIALDRIEKAKRCLMR